MKLNTNCKHSMPGCEFPLEHSLPSRHPSIPPTPNYRFSGVPPRLWRSTVGQMDREKRKNSAADDLEWKRRVP
ncbi:uncharacterized [Tachysurus ichikawai]